MVQNRALYTMVHRY